MIERRRYKWHWVGLTSFVLLGIACRDTQPPLPYNRDLGSDGILLLPTASATLDPSIAKGQADWPSFREPEFDQEPASEEKTADAPASANGQIETEIRELISEYNDLVAEATVDDLLEYYVEEQQDKLRPLLETAGALKKKLAELRGELETKLPNANERVASAFDGLAAQLDTRLAAGSLAVVSDTEVTAQPPAGSRGTPLRFLLVDDDWYIEIPTLDQLPGLTKPALDQALTAFDGFLQGLRSNQMPPETVLQQIEIAASAAKAVGDATEPTPDAAGGTTAQPESDDTGDASGAGDETGADEPAGGG